jgi:hypothetical protein
MPNYTIKGNNLITWGTSTATALGICTSASKKAGGEITKIKDEDGNTTSVVYFDDQDGVEFEFINQTGVDIPARGDAMSVCGLTDVLCDESEIKWTQGKEQMVSVKGTFYEYLTLS